jgi:uncharacterized membrane protein (DUF2068 family)
VSNSPSETTISPANPRRKAPLGLRTVAIFEFVKGSLVLLVGLGCLSLVHRDVQTYAEDIIRTLHLDPAWHYPRVFIETSAKLNDTRLRLIAGAAILYAVIRFIETYGLWHERPWAEWFAVVSASVYLPVEIFHFTRHPDFTRAGVFVFNLIIVIYLAWLLAADHRKKHAGNHDPKTPP